MPVCERCNFKFVNHHAVNQHQRTCVPLGPGQTSCDRCRKKFKSEAAKKMHIANSSKHNICKVCPEVLDFATQAKLDRHDTRVHGRLPSPPCSPPPMGEGEMKQEKKKSKKKKNKNKNKKKKESEAQAPELNTPLDLFFLTFEGYAYNPRLPPSTSFRLLEEHCGWERGSRNSTIARREYLEALQEEVQVWYGKEDDLTAWHTLCRATGHTNPPNDIPACESLLRKTHVNILDLIEWRRNGSNDEESVRVFRSVNQLRKYTLKSGKVFNLKNVEAHEEGNVVLRHLLRRLVTTKLTSHREL